LTLSRNATIYSSTRGNKNGFDVRYNIQDITRFFRNLGGILSKNSFQIAEASALLIAIVAGIGISNKPGALPAAQDPFVETFISVNAVI